MARFTLLIGMMGALAPGLARAQGLLPDCDPLPGEASVNEHPDCGVGHLFELAVNMYNFALGLAALVAFLFIVLGGVRMLVAYYGEEGESNVKAAKMTLRNGVVGFVIVLVAYLVVDTLLSLLGLSPDQRQQYFQGDVFR